MLEEKVLQFALGGAEWVLWLLVGLSVLVLAISIERVIYFVVNATPRGPYEAAVGRFLGGGEVTELERTLSGQRGMEARVILAGLAAARSTPDAAEDAMAGTLAFERLRLERLLLVIGTIASNAPYIGLFGTVLGIMKAFNDLSLETSEGASAVMAGISHALVATATGLMVAIPSVVLYNLFSRRVKDVIGRTESIASLVLSRLHGGGAA